MANLKMPNLNNKSKQYLFKNKLNVGRKSKSELIRESFYMIAIAIFLVFINYLIPQKAKFLSTFNSNLRGIISNLTEMFFYLCEVILVLFIIFSLLLSLILFIGSLNRLLKVILRKSKKINFR